MPGSDGLHLPTTLTTSCSEATTGRMFFEQKKIGSSICRLKQEFRQKLG
jgi:hypothetical protein